MEVFEVLNEGLVYSRHETREDAEAAIQRAKEEAQQDVERLEDEIDGIQEHAKGYTVQVS